MNFWLTFRCLSTFLFFSLQYFFHFTFHLSKIAISSIFYFYSIYPHLFSAFFSSQLFIPVYYPFFFFLTFLKSDLPCLLLSTFFYPTNFSILFFIYFLIFFFFRFPVFFRCCFRHVKTKPHKIIAFL